MCDIYLLLMLVRYILNKNSLTHTSKVHLQDAVGYYL